MSWVSSRRRWRSYVHLDHIQSWEKFLRNWRTYEWGNYPWCRRPRKKSRLWKVWKNFTPKRDMPTNLRKKREWKNWQKLWCVSLTNLFKWDSTFFCHITWGGRVLSFYSYPIHSSSESTFTVSITVFSKIFTDRNGDNTRQGKIFSSLRFCLGECQMWTEHGTL